MNKMCYSCGAPLSMPDFQGPAEDYCKHCTDEAGTLKSREEVQQGIAFFLQSWQPNVDDATAAARAEHYMRAMPAWAE